MKNDKRLLTIERRCRGVVEQLSLSEDCAIENVVKHSRKLNDVSIGLKTGSIDINDLYFSISYNAKNDKYIIDLMNKHGEYIIVADMISRMY